ncbi:hypothetical protein BH23CHL2_BH23CHL2_35340 [soil metagenome]
MILLYLTLAAVALLILVLVYHLVMIAYHLRRAHQSLSALAGGLRAIQGHAEPLPEKLTTINGAMIGLRDLLGGTDGNLAAVERVLGVGQRSGTRD